MNEATRLANWDEFVEIFGTADGVVHGRLGVRLLQERRHRLLGRPRRAQPAQGRAGRRSITPRAPSTSRSTTGRSRRSRSARSTRDRGATTIWFRCAHAPGAQALLTRDLDIGSGEAHVNSTRGFEVGALVRIYDRENSDYVVITEVGDKLDQVGERDAGQPPPSRRRADAPRGADVRDPRRDARSPRGLQGPADASVVAQLRTARRRAAQPARSRIEDLGDEVAGAAQPARRGADDAARRADATASRRSRPRTSIGHDIGPGERIGPVGAGGERGDRDPRRCPTRCGSTSASRDPRASSRRSGSRTTMISICENQKDRFAILDIPQTKDIEWVRRWRRRTDSFVLRLLLAVAARALRADDKDPRRSAVGLPGRLLCAGAISRASTTRPRTSRSSRRRTSRCG